MPSNHNTRQEGTLAPTSQRQGLLFGERFLDRLAGQKLLQSPRTAIVELVANCWDAGATEVSIDWPDRNTDRKFSISDNGCGMTAQEFDKRWRTLTYNRINEQGPFATFPEGISLPQRPVYGRNGLGRLAAFCFSDAYRVRTAKGGLEATFRVARGMTQPLEIDLVTTGKSEGSGTTVYAESVSTTNLSAEDARTEIGMRFLTDPNFQVFVDGQRVTFAHIPTESIEETPLDIEGVGRVKLIAIDTNKTDRTTQQHGVAWHITNRLVGDCSWRGVGGEDLVDGRRIAAKRYTFIIEADCLVDAVLPDWSGFDTENKRFQATKSVVYEKVRDFLLRVSEEDRKEAFRTAAGANRQRLSRMSLLEMEKWKAFIDEVQITCPSIKPRDLVQLSTVLANLEVAHSQYGLIYKLSECGPGDLDNLDELLEQWTVDTAKIVLDEIRTRMQLLDELARKVSDKTTQEVAELQPLFTRGLWIFGPEYETIEFTSNQTMATVVTNLLGATGGGSRNRPDFAILPDGTAGLYSRPQYDRETGAEIGVDRLVVIELKKPGITIGSEHKDQCWKYVKELFSKGLLLRDSRVDCFALGQSVDPQEGSSRTELNGNVIIRPLLYDTVITRAKSRLLKLSDRVKDAPFLRHEAIDGFLQTAEEIERALPPVTPEQTEMQDVISANVTNASEFNSDEVRTSSEEAGALPMA